MKDDTSGGKVMPFRGKSETDYHTQIINQLAHQAVTPRPRVTSGFRVLDEYLGGGFAAGSITSIDAEIRGDNTASVLVRTLALAAAYAGHRVRLLTPAQGSLGVYRRLLCGMARIPFRDMFGSCTDEQTPALVAACEELRNLDIRDVNGESAGLAGMLQAPSPQHNAVLLVDDLEHLANANTVSVSEMIQGLAGECQSVGAALVVVARREEWSLGPVAQVADVALRLAHVGHLREGGEVEVIVKHGGPSFGAVMQFERLWALA